VLFAPFCGHINLQSNFKLDLVKDLVYIYNHNLGGIQYVCSGKHL